MIEPDVKTLLRNGKIFLAGPGKEIHRKSIQPHIFAADTPKAEGAV